MVTDIRLKGLKEIPPIGTGIWSDEDEEEDKAERRQKRQLRKKLS